MKSYILIDADFRELFLSLKRDMRRDKHLTPDQILALDEVHRMYHFHVVSWAQKQGVNVVPLLE